MCHHPFTVGLFGSPGPVLLDSTVSPDPRHVQRMLDRFGVVGVKYSAQPVTARNEDAGEVGNQAGPDLELEEATARAVKAMNLLALQSIIEGLAAPQSEVDSLKPADYGELTGVLSCKACGRPIRDHEVTEFHTQA